MIQTNVHRDYGEAMRTRPLGCCRSGRKPFQCALGVALILGLASWLDAPALVRAEDRSTSAAPTLRPADLFALATLSGEFFESVPDASLLTVEKIVAFEENPRFVYLAGRTDQSVRRVVLLKPGTFVVEDRVRVSADGTPVRWTLLAPGEATIDGKKFKVVCAEGELLGEALLPADARLRIAPDDRDSKKRVVDIAAQSDGQEARFLHVFQVRHSGGESAALRCKLDQKDDGRRLTVAIAAEILKLALPAESDAAASIAIAHTDGRSLLDRRPLPSGIMPYGEKGVQLLQRWDTPYHDDRRPGWDTGRVAPELKKAVEEGKVGKGRAIVLGCGLGTNALYLAGKGFEVTGVDVAPTALARAEENAREAGVDVRWLVADVLALPELEPFDLIFDRGCYHHVRQYNAAGYVEAVCRLSHPGTRLLLLAGSAKREGRGGPPKIKEEEIHEDFSGLFEFEWFREIRFDSRNPDAKGPQAWSVLMRRKEKR